MMAKAKPAGDYEVGYKKPPKHSQFQKGHSGNGAGRPKGALGVSTLVRQIADQEIEGTANGKLVRRSKLELAVEKNFKKAAEGSLPHMRWIEDHLEKAHDDDLRRNTPYGIGALMKGFGS